MSPNDVITFFQTMIDDEPDADMVTVLLDAAYTKRNDERMWTFLIKLYSSITHDRGDTWQTQKTLPDDFSEPMKLFVGASNNEYDPVPYEGILSYLGGANKFSIDFASNKLLFTGPGNGQTAYLWYKYFPTSLIGLSDADMALSTTIVWPKRFCPLLAFDMASIHTGGIDADDIARQQVPFLNVAHRQLYNSMIAWDTKRRMKLYQNSSSQQPIGPNNTPPDVVDMSS